MARFRSANFNATPLLLLAGAVVVFMVGKPFLDSIKNLGSLISGGTDKLNEVIPFATSKDEKQAQNVKVDPGSFWNPLYWVAINKNRSIIIQNFATSKSQIERIKKCFGYFSDDIATAQGILKECKSRADLSKLADDFKKLEGGTDFYTYLLGVDWPADRFDSEEINVVTNYFNKMPIARYASK